MGASVRVVSGERVKVTQPNNSVVAIERDTQKTSIKQSYVIVAEVAEIPSNYGLITWDGSVLTVS